MTGTLKGLFKGLRYFSQIFDSKEQEMQIGVPTDVKHVAHIGWDGTSSNPPSWMDGFKSVPEIANEPSNPLKESKKTAKKLASEGTQDSTNDEPKNKMRRKTATGNESPINSPKHRSDGTKQPRHHSTSNSTLDSSKGNQKLNLSIESSSPNPNGIPKQSRRKRVKATCDRSSKSSGCHLRTENEGQRRTD